MVYKTRYTPPFPWVKTIHDAEEKDAVRRRHIFPYNIERILWQEGITFKRKLKLLHCSIELCNDFIWIRQLHRFQQQTNEILSLPLCGPEGLLVLGRCQGTVHDLCGGFGLVRVRNKRLWRRLPLRNLYTAILKNFKGHYSYEQPTKGVITVQSYGKFILGLYCKLQEALYRVTRGVDDQLHLVEQSCPGQSHWPQRQMQIEWA